MKDLPAIFENLDVKVDNKDVVNMLTAEHEDALLEERKAVIQKRAESLERVIELKKELFERVLEIGKTKAQPKLKVFQTVRKNLLPLVDKRVLKNMSKNAGSSLKIGLKGTSTDDLANLLKRDDMKCLRFVIQNYSDFFISGDHGLDAVDVSITKSIRSLADPVTKEEKIANDCMDDIIKLDAQIRDMPRKSRLFQAKVTRNILNKTTDGKKLLSEAESTKITK